MNQEFSATPVIQVSQAEDCKSFTVTITNNGVIPWDKVTNIDLTISGPNGIAYSADITTDVVSSALTGTNIVGVAGDNEYTGTGTIFTTELDTSKFLYIGDSNTLSKIYAIDSDTSVTVCEPCFSSGTFTDLHWVYPYYTIYANDLMGSDIEITSGDYIFALAFTIDGVSYSYATTLNFNCNAFCCVYDKLAEVALDCDNCADSAKREELLQGMMAWALYNSYKYACSCGNTVSANTIITKLNDFCNYNKCKTC